MKDHVVSSHLTKFENFRENRDNVIDLEKSIQMSIKTKVYNLVSVYPNGQMT